MRGRLVVTSGPDLGRVFDFKKAEPMLVGRSQAAGARLIDPRASRSHCRIDFQSGVFRLSDLGSKGGTFVNGDRIAEYDLQPGDVIRAGRSELRFETVGGEEPSEPSEAADSSAAIADDIQPPYELLGKRLAHFAIGEELGAGASGVVFSADDEKNRRPVAMKVLWPQLCRGEADSSRFVQTMRSMVAVTHPNIVQVYEAAKTGEYCWLAMELVDGESLSQVIRRIGATGVLDWRYAIRAAAQVGRALQCAHSRGIVHGNLTPTNILVRFSDQIMKLGDLMLAEAVSCFCGPAAEWFRGAAWTPASLAADPAADPFYLSPEHADPASQIDARSDTYSLGAALYALLTGRPPCAGSTPAELADNILHAAPEDPRSRQPAVPEALAGLALRMLEKRRADRYQSPEAFLADLERIGRDQRIAI
jgi:serine/threonine protein kinase